GNTLSRRGSRPHWITCGLEKRDNPHALPSDGCWSLPSRDAGGAPNVRDDKAVLLSLRHDPGPRNGGFQGRRPCQVPPRPGKPNSSSLTRFRGPLRLASKFCLRVGNRTDQHLLQHISFLRVLG